jgi:dUTP pyrophosphatase
MGNMKAGNNQMEKRNEIIVGFMADYTPQYMTDGAACFDIQSAEDYTFRPNELHVVGSGLRCEIPEGWAMLVFARSSLGLKRLIIPNSVGVIDSDYRGEIKVPLLYLGDEPISIQAGQRIAQGMLIKCHRAAFEKRNSLEETDRGSGGFGSTGEK